MIEIHELVIQARIAEPQSVTSENTTFSQQDRDQLIAAVSKKVLEDVRRELRNELRCGAGSGGIGSIGSELGGRSW